MSAKFIQKHTGQSWSNFKHKTCATFYATPPTHKWVGLVAFYVLGKRGLGQAPTVQVGLGQTLACVTKVDPDL